MKRVYVIAAIIILVVLLIASAVFNNNAKAKNAASGFAVIELFTSEGCSSCPPADAALAKVSEDYAGKVFALEFHVDYWDRLGWKDIFSSHTYTQRQGDYSRQFHLNSVYTPQAVVNGKTEFTGSNTVALNKAINKELGNISNVDIDLKTTVNARNIIASYTVAQSQTSVLNIALVQLQAQSQVTRGENAGNVLHHANVVRDFASADVSNNTSGNIKLTLPEGTAAKDFAVIAYLQNTSTGVINGAKKAALN